MTHVLLNFAYPIKLNISAKNTVMKMLPKRPCYEFIIGDMRPQCRSPCRGKIFGSWSAVTLIQFSKVPEFGDLRLLQLQVPVVKLQLGGPLANEIKVKLILHSA